MPFTTNIVRHKFVFALIAVALIGLGALVVWPTQGSPITDEEKAANIAWEEVLRHFPEGKSFDIQYTVYEARSLPDKGPNIWLVTYDLPDGPTDQMIWVTVDTEKKEVLLFDQAAG
ncbi:MAG: hypothetical protein A3C93_00850 [Candidatus Lloydbacteria bacterium RIFCSPHIGHO2_02_FULL_54_17]|uniref:Uncharacterized protein n=1 Tax=Candidatus Lloydbacteria bacterium RIFCSPHIGHO2_02_FULL_54_17 TaxID=1798664 RepID=A0A1G2DHR0_9BACT|nr:MAG: hypothetical protein A2762_05030 [Candidatus Lloydbacteria bacterium RIFCSPHIGHO2_01_FULL_54_11]OGZ13185.1 MAG: hypothetical protein A3C93_00850 [Candidatus Lloydbacteria bacterium RIFCSPHIGHO2_02_FULL_54_17]OGZ16071.1 MAG: hypothetical protein A3H76_01430 [Candidatus Lloydbacteria bacterium RIFCSPLOWO2_02_FULL_54_12]